MSDSSPMKDASAAHYLANERDQIHAYVRSNFEHLISWFTFFLTANYIAIGWFASQAVEGKVQSQGAIYLITGFFLIQNVLAALACKQAGRYLIESNQRILAIARELLQASNVSGEDVPAVSSPLPISLYERIVSLMTYTVISLILFWIGFLAVTVSIHARTAV